MEASFLGSGGQGFFLPGHMGGGLVIGLMAIRVSGLFQALLCYVLFRQRPKTFQDDVSSRCIFLEINKISPFF